MYIWYVLSSGLVRHLSLWLLLDILLGLLNVNLAIGGLRWKSACCHSGAATEVHDIPSRRGARKLRKSRVDRAVGGGWGCLDYWECIHCGMDYGMVGSEGLERRYQLGVGRFIQRLRPARSKHRSSLHRSLLKG